MSSSRRIPQRVPTGGSDRAAGRARPVVLELVLQGMGTHIPLGGGHVPSVDFASAGWIWMLPRIIVPRSLANTVVPGGCTNGRVQQIALATSIVVWPAAGPRMC